MKFENPIMNISMFEVENVVTGSGNTPADPKSAEDEAKKFAESKGVTAMISFTESN